MFGFSIGFVPWVANATTDVTSGANYVSALLATTSEPEMLLHLIRSYRADGNKRVVMVDSDLL